MVSPYVQRLHCRSSSDTAAPTVTHTGGGSQSAMYVRVGTRTHSGHDCAWSHSYLLMSVGIREHAPYRQVLTHGWTLDEQGRPMSKSLGNVILPTEICEKWGADLLRLWVASQDYHSDVRMSESGMKQLSEAYFKIRNTFRFALGNLAGFDPSRDAVPDDSLQELDRWMLGRTGRLVAKCLEFYESFDFHRVYD